VIEFLKMPFGFLIGSLHGRSQAYPGNETPVISLHVASILIG